MKTSKLSEKIKNLLAANRNAPPNNTTEARVFFSELMGVNLADMEGSYSYSVSCYIAVPRNYIQRKPAVRRVTSKVLFWFFKARGLDDPEAVRATKEYIHKQFLGFFTTDTSTLLQRARARKLTPAARNYRTGVGIEIEGHSYMSREDLADRLPLFSKVVYDGSIQTRGSQTSAEVVALLNRDEMEPRLHRLCDRLNRLGFGTNKSCGLHVHIDCRHLSFEQVCERAKVMNKWITALVELVPLSRRENRYCRLGFSRTDRYRAVNVTSYQKHSTLEVRIHSASSSYQKILAWVRLCELLFSLKKAPRASTGCLSALDQLPLAEYERSYWRARHSQLNPAQYMGAVVSSTGGEE